MLNSLTEPFRNASDTLSGAQNTVRRRVRRNISARNGPYNYEEPEIPGPPVKEWLEPVGDSQIYVTPNEPVDPRDCDQWPHSPYCSGRSLGPPVPAAIRPQIERNECEICITLTSSLFGIVGPQYTVCYRSKDPACQVELPQPNDPGPNALGIGGVRTTHRCGGSTYYWTKHRLEMSAYNAYEIWNINRARQNAQDVIDEEYRGINTLHQFYSVGSPHRAISQELLRHWDNGNQNWVIEHYTHYPTNANTGERRTPWSNEDYPLVRIHFYENYTSINGDLDGYGTAHNAVYTEVLEAPFPPCREGSATPSPPPQFTPPEIPKEEEPPMDCNCAETEEMLQCIYQRLGCEQYPVSLPDTLIENSSNAQIEKQDLTSILGWLIEQIDAVTGQFPLELEVEDTDPTQEGNQTQKISLPNIAETLIELYGLALKNSVTGDTHTDILLRLVAELISTKNASLITQDYVKANASFLGYRGNPKKRTINYAFDPENISDLTKVLNASTKDIVGFTEDDPETAVGFLQRIVFVSGILKEIFFKNKDRMPDLIDQIEQYTQDGDGDDSRWKQYLSELNNPSSLQNLYRPTPNAVDIDANQK